MGPETIHPTNHAIDRFKERVLPLLPDDSRKRMNDKKNIKQRVYDLARRADISTKEHQIMGIYNHAWKNFFGHIQV